MEGDRHFSHPHPLTNFQDDKETDESDNYHSCKICGLPILSAPSYTCTIVSCHSFLHESCAQKFSHTYTHPNHTTPLDDSTKHMLCLRAGISHHFTYKCEGIAISICILWLQLQCLVQRSKPNTRAIHLTSHKSLRFCLCVMPVGRNMKVSSSGANTVISGFIKTAPYCLLLSRSPLVLCLCFSYILFLANYRYEQCIICNKALLITSNAIYLCPQTFIFVHVRCGLGKIQSSKNKARVDPTTR
ncbi:uncharacterized protein LOC121778761 isoform X2 [Salvia splendens]|uniref:uncharacterized protein LOC121778761 isoform X2 n=1 Tax=Salvia splendens TaxID=180675 RepID=UPI001C27D8F5|nr:uncharacterized protein LOC121778761 isoform X2 [Salvia splendens]